MVLQRHFSLSQTEKRYTIFSLYFSSSSFPSQGTQGQDGVSGSDGDPGEDVSSIKVRVTNFYKPLK